MTRFFDIIFSVLGLIFLSPVFLFLSVWIKVDDPGPVFYKQKRVGRFGKEFWLIKFRSMYLNADKQGLLTVGGKDPRITKSGHFIRRYKLDELPQLLNVLKGEMSIVGPRPEVRKYVELYSSKQREILKVRPGITDMASIKYKNENEILANQSDPERYYIEHIMKDKIELNNIFITSPTVANYFRIILLTIKGIV